MATPDFGGSDTKLSTMGFDQLSRPKVKIIKVSNRQDNLEKDALETSAKVLCHFNFQINNECKNE